MYVQPRNLTRAYIVLKMLQQVVKESYHQITYFWNRKKSSGAQHLSSNVPLYAHFKQNRSLHIEKTGLFSSVVST